MADTTPRDTLNINVSGTLFQVQATTLLRFPNSRLAQIAKERSATKKEESIYLDQDAELFGHILRCCRSGEVHVPTTICPHEFLKELEFWGVPVSNILPCCWPAFYKADDKVTILEKLAGVTDDVPPEKRLLSCREKIWLFLDNPNYSLGAKVFSLFFFFFRTCPSTFLTSSNYFSTAFKTKFSLF